MLFIQVLRMSVPSLAEALKAGLISVLAPSADAASAQISLGYGPAVLSAIARRRKRRPGRRTAPAAR